MDPLLATLQAPPTENSRAVPGSQPSMLRVQVLLDLLGHALARAPLEELHRLGARVLVLGQLGRQLALALEQAQQRPQLQTVGARRLQLGLLLLPELERVDRAAELRRELARERDELGRELLDHLGLRRAAGRAAREGAQPDGDAELELRALLRLLGEPEEVVAERGAHRGAAGLDARRPRRLVREAEVRDPPLEDALVGLGAAVLGGRGADGEAEEGGGRLGVALLAEQQLLLVIYFQLC